jgi:predicted nucleic acid-binding protein
MSVDRYTFDTNLLFYALDLEAGSKYRIAQKILGSADYNRAVVLLQTLGELSHSIQRKYPKAVPEADRFVQKAASVFEVVSANTRDLSDALAARSRHGLSFWDAMLWATSRRAGCSLVLTDDFQDGRTLDGVTFRNPFKLSSTELDKLIG